MLKELRIRNLAIIGECALTFDAAFTVLTGETGAGKSILVDGLNLALGERADRELVRAGAEEALVEALFDVATEPAAAAMLAGLDIEQGDGEILLRRVVNASGKGRCAINGTPVPLTLLKRLGDHLLDLHGQHEHQLLLDGAQHALFLDAFGDLLALREEVGGAYRSWRERQEEVETLREAEEERARRLDLLAFQIQEIKTANVAPGEEVRLGAEKSRLMHAQKLGEALTRAYEALAGEGGAGESLGAAAAALKPLAAADPAGIPPALEAVSRLAGFVAEEATGLRALRDALEADPARLEAVEERLDLLERLKRKYGGSEEAVLEALAVAEGDAAGLAGAAERSAQAAAQLEEIRVSLSELALRLSDERQRVAERFAQAVARELAELAMDRADFGVRLTQRAEDDGPVRNADGKYHVTAEGIDVVEFYLAPNVGEGTRPLKAIASGGELSRIMLALKAVLAKTDRVGTLVFDEIDVGIGGRVAETVGRKLKAIGGERQVVCVTHLPQIAARATRHLVVRKEADGEHTRVTVEPVTGPARVEELARMLAGAEVTGTALQHAAALLDAA